MSSLREPQCPPWAQRLLDVGLHVSFERDAHLRGDHFSVAVDEERRRHGVEAAVRLAEAVAVHQHRVGHLLFCDELGDGGLVLGPAGLVVRLQVVAFGGDAENLKTLAAYLLRSSTSQGVSILQGPHQVAQKLMSTALPL